MFIMCHKYWSLEQMGKDLLKKILREMKMNKYFLYAFSSVLMVKVFCLETKMFQISIANVKIFMQREKLF